MTNNNEIQYGSKDTIEEKLEFKDAKARVTIMLDGDVILAAKEKAKDEKTKYQTLINKILRQVLLGEEKQISPAEFRELEKRVSKLEAVK